MKLGGKVIYAAKFIQAEPFFGYMYHFYPSRAKFFCNVNGPLYCLFCVGFWLVWSLITLLGCCCAYHRRRYFGNYHGAAQSYLYSTHLALVIPEPEPSEEHAFPKYKLPSYAEVEAMPNLGPPDDCEGAPPPYTLASLNWENPGPAPPYIQWYENDAVNTAEGGHVSGQTSQPHCQTTEADAEPVLSLESAGT